MYKYLQLYKHIPLDLTGSDDKLMVFLCSSSITHGPSAAAGVVFKSRPVLNQKGRMCFCSDGYFTGFKN